MTRLFLAVVGLVGAVGLAQANYLIFMVNVSETKSADQKGAVLAVVMVETKGPPRLAKNGRYQIYHKWGNTVLFGDKTMGFRDPENLTKPKTALPTLAKEWEAKLAELKADMSADKRLEVAEWALNHGMLPEFTEKMAEAAKSNSPSAAAKAVLAAYHQVQEELRGKDGTEDRPLPMDDAFLKQWKDRVGGKDPYLTNHYSVLYDSDVANPAEVKSHADRLEKLLHGFYYWFALKGKALPLPQRRLGVVLITKPEDFKNWQAKFDAGSLVTSGFYSRRDHVAVLSSTRLDDVYTALSNFNRQELWQRRWDMSALLKGQGYKKGSEYDEWSRAQSLALVQKAMQEEGELQTVSHEGTRQLVTAAGLLPRNVAAPEWIEFGMASFFEVSKNSLWPGYGGSSWDYLIDYKALEKDKRLDKPEEALERVISDSYFRQARLSDDPQALHKAQVMAWSLTYFLAQRKRNDGSSAIDDLLHYYEELAKLPRDLDFDDDVHLGCFARALGLADPTKPRGIDPAKMARFAKEWSQFIWTTSPSIPQGLALELRKALKPDSATPAASAK